MLRFFYRAFACVIATSVVVSSSLSSASASGHDVLSRVRARGFVRCAGVVRPGIAVPTPDGKRWFGMDPDICRAIAAAVLGDPERMTFRPYFGDDRPGRDPEALDDVVFLTGAELVGNVTAEAAPLVLGPVVVHDSIALLVPDSGVKHASELVDKTVCVEPGSPADRALTAYFDERKLALHEHPYQEVDEMRQAYGDGKCDALAGPLTTLGSVRGDPSEGHASDRIVPETLADDPVFAATYGDARWSRIVWWTFSALVDAEDGTIGVPPAVGSELDLQKNWDHDAIAASGNYAAIFGRNLGADSRFKLVRGENELWRNGGTIFGLFVE